MSRSDFFGLAQLKGVPVQAGTPFFIRKNIRKPLISLMFFMLAQPCTGKNAYDHDVRTHHTQGTCGRNVCFYPVPPVPACATDFLNSDRFGRLFANTHEHKLTWTPVNSGVKNAY